MRTRGQAQDLEPAATAPRASSPPAARDPEPEPAGSSWAAIAAHTAEAVAPAEDEEESEEFPEAGDLVQHFAFGLCDVLMARGDSLKIRDAHGSGRIREVRIDMLKVMPPRDKDGKRLFKLVRKTER
jgi:hypothetical protein